MAKHEAIFNFRDELKKSFTERIATGLKRNNVRDPAKWAEMYRVMANDDNNIVKNEPWSFRYRPWLRGMHLSPNKRNVGQKAAQMGYTETLLNLAFYAIDVQGRNVLYVLPNKNPECGDFSSSRFDAARTLSPHLMNLFSETDNIGHKRAGHANFFLRGSQSRSGLKSNPISVLLMDEVAEFVEENIPLALARVDGKADYLIWMVSTPTIEGHGISIYYNQSDKQEFVFKCPSCSKHITLRYPDSLVITGEDAGDPNIVNSYYKCTECDVRLPGEREAKADLLANAFWVPTVANQEYAGFTINQMYSPVKSPIDMVRAHFAAQRNPADEIELYNSKLGLSHEAKGSRVQDEELEHAMLYGVKNRRKENIFQNQVVTMGVDVGKWIHYEICMWKVDHKRYNGDIHSCTYCIVVDHGKVRDFEDLDKLMDQYRVLSCVVDKNPESRKAKEFCDRYRGRARLCIFTRGIKGRMFGKPREDDDDLPDEYTFSVDRTSWLDMSLGRFRNKTISLPIDTNLEYRDDLKNITKTYTKDADGNPLAKYVTGQNLSDHYAFARTYCEMALSFIPLAGPAQDLESVP